MEFIEFETKYRVEGDLVYKFKQLIEQDYPDFEEFLYVQSDDIYYVDKNDDFLRYRFSNSKKNKRKEITFKKKIGNTDNIIRKEINLRVDYNDKETVEAMAEVLGFKKNFRISKISHIYEFKDATLPFYSVIDEDGKIDHFIEIEVNEDLIPKITEEEAWEIIKKYEQVLAPLGISPQKRLKKSLFEIYKK